MNRACVAWAIVLLLPGFVSEALADVDPDLFPQETRALQWREVGPYRGGRSAAVTGIQAQPQTYYFGATGGGVWKTVDGGQSWVNVSDGYFGGSIGAVAVSAWDPNVVYAGGGEKTVRGNVSHGDGMWRSTDAGESWEHIGLADSRHIPRIRIHPRKPELVYAAVLGHLHGPSAERGIYRSSDGGDSWERVLFVNDQAGAVDLVMDPTNPRILYASFWRVLRTPYSLESGGNGSGIHKSTDGGDTWTELSGNEGLPRGTLGISGIAVSPTDNQNLYAVIEAEAGGVFRSRDGGETWVKTSEDRNLRQRAWYYSRIYADPADSESVYVLNVRFHHSKDGGKSFVEIPTPHGDNHDLWIDPHNPDRMIESNDGGANVSYDAGATWSTQSNQPTAQFYRVSTDNDFPYRLLGGQQDNSAVRIRSRSAAGGNIGVRDWEPTAGGESGHIVAKPDNPDIVVGGSYGGYLQLYNHRTGERQSIDVWPDNPMGWGAAELKHRFQWNFPIQFSVHDSDSLYVAANRLFHSDNMGQSWTVISPDLTRNDKSRMGASGGPITKDNTSVEYYGTIFALAQSPQDKAELWVGTDDGKIQITRDGGTAWSDVTPRSLPEWAQINSLDVHPTKSGVAYVAATRYKSDDLRPYLYRTTDWGRSWKKITDGIHQAHFTRVLRADPIKEGLLFSGTENGVYYSLNNGSRWEPLQLNLPQVPITDLAIKGSDLIVATQGRGFWILDGLTVLRQLDLETSSRTAHLYTSDPAMRMVAGGASRAAPNTGTNPPPGAVFYYSIGAGVDDETPIELSVFAQADADEPIWTWTRKPAADETPDDESAPKPDEPDTQLLTSDLGLNRFAWDLRYPGMKRFDELILWNDMKTGPLAPPAAYRAELKVGDSTQSAEFEVLPDPRTRATHDDFMSQFEFVLSCRDLLSRTHQEIAKLRSLRAQLETLQSRLEGDQSADPEPPAALVTRLETLLSDLTRIEEALYQTDNESRQDPLNFPIRLNDKLAGVMRLVASGDKRPTESAVEVKQQLSAAIEEQLSDLEQIWNERLPAVNQEIKNAGIDLVSVSSD